MARLIAATRRFWARQAGASLVEYSLLIGLIALVCLSAVANLGQAVKALFNMPNF